MAELRQRRANLSEDKTATTNEEARKNYTNWWSAVKAETKPEELNLAGTYPMDACVKKLEGTTVYGVIVDAQGSVVNTELIKGASYPIFNNQALEQIKSRSFLNPTGNPKPYLVNVNFKYSSDCPSLSIATPEATPEPVAEEPASTPPEAADSAPEEPIEAPQQSEPDPSTQTPKPEPATESPSPDAATPEPASPGPVPPPQEALEAPASEQPQAEPEPAPAVDQEAPVAPTPPDAPPATSQSPSETLGGPINSPNPLMQPKPARNTPAASEGEEDTTPENQE